MAQFKTVLVTGGGGYVGAVLVPKLLDAGYDVKVVDLFIYGEEVLDRVKDNPRLRVIKGDIRDSVLLEKALTGVDAVIHLACISNDPSFELNPELGKSINLDAFEPLVAISRDKQVKRFIYASSSSVYGVKQEENVTEDMSLEPLTDYSKFKAECETILLRYAADDFTISIIRPATVCGYSPRLRLDLTVNILTNHAINNRRIRVFGGDQKRPNLHIEDMTDLYMFMLEQPHDRIHRKIYNVGYENYKVREVADMVNAELGGNIEIVTEPTDDMRSYHVCSDKIKNELGFTAKHSIQRAIGDLRDAFAQGLVGNHQDERYYNVKRMKAINIK